MQMFILERQINHEDLLNVGLDRSLVRLCPLRGSALHNRGKIAFAHKHLWRIVGRIQRGKYASYEPAHHSCPDIRSRTLSRDFSADAFSQRSYYWRDRSAVPQYVR